MSTYKSIKGESIVGVASNFTSPSTEGQVFYNTTDNVFKSLVATKAWHSGANLGSSRYGLAACGIQTAQVVAGGSDLPFGNLTDAEEYNGTGWSSISSIGTARYALAGCGTSTASLIFGGNHPARKNETEEWNGTSWSTPPANIPVAGNLHGEAGIQTAALGFGGYTPGVTDATIEYDGTAWAINPATLATARGTMGGTGTKSSALASCGVTPSGGGKITNTEEFTAAFNATKTVTTST